MRHGSTRKGWWSLIGEAREGFTGQVYLHKGLRKAERVGYPRHRGISKGTGCAGDSEVVQHPAYGEGVGGPQPGKLPLESNRSFLWP